MRTVSWAVAFECCGAGSPSSSSQEMAGAAELSSGTLTGGTSRGGPSALTASPDAVKPGPRGAERTASRLFLISPARPPGSSPPEATISAIRSEARWRISNSCPEGWKIPFFISEKMVSITWQTSEIRGICTAWAAPLRL